MRKLVAALVVGMGLMGFGSQAFAYDDTIIETTPEVGKLERGATNFALGIPDEVIAHTVSGATTGTDSLPGWIGSTVSGVVVGTFWGLGRMGSGFIDMVTFPFVINNDEPVMPPDHHT